MIFNKIKNIKFVGGFTIVETLVAISILLVGISAAFSAAQSGLSATTAIKDRITAVFLAQEAMEAVRNVKDQNLLAQNFTGGTSTNPDWLLGLLKDGSGGPGPCSTDCDFNFDFGGTLEFISCADTPIGDCTLKVDSLGRFSHKDNINSNPVSPTQASKFSRVVYIEEISSGEKKEARVRVVVTWPGHDFTTTETLFNWFAP